MHKRLPPRQLTGLVRAQTNPRTDPRKHTRTRTRTRTCTRRLTRTHNRNRVRGTNKAKNVFWGGGGGHLQTDDLVNLLDSNDPCQSNTRVFNVQVNQTYTCIQRARVVNVFAGMFAVVCRVHLHGLDRIAGV